jgi:hypothetical protein
VPTNASGYERPDWEAVFDRTSTAHVLLGTVKNGVPSGFHHAPTGSRLGHARVRGAYQLLPNGIYEARVSLQGPGGRWVEKSGGSKMFPDDWAPEEVRGAAIGAAEDAWHHDRIDREGDWDGYVTGRHGGSLYRYHLAGGFQVKGAKISLAKTFHPHMHQPQPGIDELGVGL